MNEALKDAYSAFVKGGYNGTIEDYKKLLETNQEALNESFGIFKNGGYNGNIEDFSSLLGVGKQKDPAKETANVGSEKQAVASESILETGLSDSQEPKEEKSGAWFLDIELPTIPEYKTEVEKFEELNLPERVTESTAVKMPTIRPGSDLTMTKEDIEKSSLKSKLDDEIANIYNKNLKKAPKTEFGTINFDDEETWSNIHNNTYSDFVSNNKIIQEEIIPEITSQLEPTVLRYAEKLKIEMGLDNPENITQEKIDKLYDEVDKHFNKLLSAKLSQNSDFDKLTKAFSSKIEDIDAPSYKRFLKGKDSPNLLKMEDYVKLNPQIDPVSKTLFTFVENMYNMGRSVGNKLDNAGVMAGLGNKVEKDKDLERNEKLIAEYNLDNNIEGVWIEDDKKNFKQSWKFIPKKQWGSDNDTAWRIITGGAAVKEGTFNEFKEAYDKWAANSTAKTVKKITEIQDKELKLAQWNEDEFDKIMRGEDVISNAIGLTGEQLPQMALALVTLGASSGIQIGANIYADGIDIEARKRFDIPDNEYPNVEQLSEVLADDKFMDALEAKTVGGGFIGGQLERIGAGKVFSAFATKGVSSILRGNYKNFLKQVANGTIRNTQRGFYESVTEVLQETIEMAATGVDIDPKRLFKAGGTGAISAFTLGVGGNVATQSVQEIKTINKVIAGKLNKNSSEAFLNNKIKDLKTAFENNEISEAAYKEAVGVIQDVKKSNASIPNNFTPESKQKALDLLIEKQELSKDMEGKDSSMTSYEQERISEINTELKALSITEKVLADTKKGINKRQSMLEKAQRAIGIDLAVKSFDTKQELQQYLEQQGESKAQTKRSMGQYGTIFQKDGRQEILINKEVALEDARVTTADHEFLHAVLYETVRNNEQAQINLGQALYTELAKQTDGQIRNTEFAQRLEGYLANAKTAKQQANAWEEALTLFAEGLGDGTFKANKTFIQKIKEFFQNLFGGKINKEIRFDTGADVVKFIQDYNKSFEKGKWGEGIKKLAREGAKGKLVESKPVMTEEEVIKASERSNLDGKLNDKYNGNAKKLIADMLTFPVNKSAFAQEIGGVTNAITKRLYDPIPADQKKIVTRQDFIDSLISEAATMVDREYNGLQNLDKFVSNRLNLRANNLASRLGIEESIKADVTERKDIVGTETAESTIETQEKAQKEKPKVKPFIEAINPNTKIGNDTFENVLNNGLRKNISLAIKKIDAQVSANRTVTPFIQDIKNGLAEDLYKDVAKIIDQYPGGYEQFLKDYRKTLLYNYTTTYLSKNPLFKKGILKSVGGKMGKDNQGRDMFIPKWVAPKDISKQAGVKKYDWVDDNGKKLKIDRDNAGQRGLTSGPIIMKRNPNIDNIISEDEFVNFHYDDGPTRKKVKANARLAIARQIASESGFEKMQSDFTNEGPLYQEFKEKADLLGKGLSENAAVEIAKDIDRGVVKFSQRTITQVSEALERGRVASRYLVNEKQAADIWDYAVQKGNWSQAFKSYITKFKNNNPAIEPEYIDFFLDSIFNERTYLLEASQNAANINKGKAYEKALKDYLRRKGFSIEEIKQTKGDIAVKILDNDIAIELKLNENAQISSVSVANMFNDGEIMYSKNIPNKSFLNDAINDYKDQINKIKEFALNKYPDAKILPSGNLKLAPNKEIARERWAEIKNTKGYPMAFADGSLQNILYLYQSFSNEVDAKPISFMQIGGKGIFALDNSPATKDFPKLTGKARYTVRADFKNGTIYTRVFPTLLNVSESGIDLDSKTGIQDFVNKVEQNIKTDQVTQKMSERLNEDFNDIIEDKFGIESYKRFSEVVGRRRGYKKGKWKLFIPPSAEDFQGLLYDLYGKGRRGELQKEWFDQNLILPYLQGVANLEKAKQSIKRTYEKFLKENKGIGKKLRQKIEDGDFTFDQAIRVYLWTQAGYDIPGLSKRDQDKLNSIVQNDETLIDLGIQLQSISQQEKGWIKPEKYWDSETLLSDLSRLTQGVSRQEYLKEFIENVDIIFSKENKNKLRAAVGNAWVDAAENAIARMKSGVNHVAGGDAITNSWLKWVNNSVGSIMFFNRRSATLQLLSTTNFINWSDNNPIKAAQAFANQKQYWKDWSMIFNSDKLKERRGGLKTDVTESEIANAAAGSKNKVSSIISYLLKKGFLPTQIADSIAIASGGATFYRNRVNTYLKQGLSNKEAEKKAFEDFSRLSDEAQQSSDPLLVSQEQSTTAGRLILAFANTPQQYMRLSKKAARDLINGRGDAKTHISKILYYTFIQNLIFSTLQAAGFALIPGFDDEDEELEDAKIKQNKTMAMALNSMADTVLRGMGLYGAIASTIKNAAIKYIEEKAKDPFKQDMDKVVYAALNLSPPIGSKAGKIKSALNTEIFEKDVLEARGMNLTIDGKFVPNPAYSAIGKMLSATANIPLDRAYDEIASITEMLDSRNTAWQRLALGLGYKTWQVGATIEEHDLIKATAKKERKVKGIQKSSETRRKNREKKEEQKIEELINYIKGRQSKE